MSGNSHQRRVRRRLEAQKAILLAKATRLLAHIDSMLVGYEVLEAVTSTECEECGEYWSHCECDRHYCACSCGCSVSVDNNLDRCGMCSEACGPC